MYEFKLWNGQSLEPAIQHSGFSVEFTTTTKVNLFLALTLENLSIQAEQGRETAERHSVHPVCQHPIACCQSPKRTRCLALRKPAQAKGKNIT